MKSRTFKKSWYNAKVVFREKFIALNIYIRKEEKFHVAPTLKN